MFPQLREPVFTLKIFLKQEKLLFEVGKKKKNIDGSAPLRKLASELAQYNAEATAEALPRGKWRELTINVISYTCASRVKVSAVKIAFGRNYQTSVYTRTFARSQIRSSPGIKEISFKEEERGEFRERGTQGLEFNIMYCIYGLMWRHAGFNIRFKAATLKHFESHMARFCTKFTLRRVQKMPCTLKTVQRLSVER